MGQCGPVVKADSTYAGGLGSISSAGRKNMVVCPHYQTGQTFILVFEQVPYTIAIYWQVKDLLRLVNLQAF